MKRIVNRNGGYWIEKPQSTAAGVVVTITGLLWAVFGTTSLIAGTPGGAVLATLIFGIPAMLIATLARTRRYRVAAVLDARQVAGGVWLNIMDDRNVRHEVVTDEATSQGVAYVLTGRTGVEA